MKRIALFFLFLLIVYPRVSLADDTYYNFVNGSSGAGTLNGTEKLAVTKGSNQTFQSTPQDFVNLTASQLGSFTAVVTNSPYNASGFIALASTTTGVPSGSTVIPVNNTTGFATGQVAIVSLAGTSGNKNFAGFISSVTTGSSITFSNTAVTGASLPSTATSGTTGTTTSIPQTHTTLNPATGYLIYSLGSTTLDGAVVNGATSIPIVNASSYAIGQGVLITGGATSAANLVTQITNIVGNTLTISPGISNASGVASGINIQHDDSVAIQTAINLVSNIKNVSIYFPDGVYQVNRPAVSPGTTNSALVIPTVPYYQALANLDWFPMATLELTSNAPASMSQNYLPDHTVLSWSGAIIKTDISGYHLMNSIGNSTSLDCGAGTMSNVELYVNNLTFRTYPNPNLSVVNGAHIASLYVNHVNIDSGETGHITTPTHNTLSFGYVVSPANCNGGNNVITNLDMSGFYYGLETSEHGRFENIRGDGGIWPLWVNWTGNNFQYGQTGVNFQFNGTQHGIGTSGDQQIDFQGINIEHNGGITNIDDISDASNHLFGMVAMDLLSSPGPAAATIVGAGNLHVANYKSTAFPLPQQTFSELSNSHYTAASNGHMVYCSNCTIANPCASGGNGALAKKLNGSWVCN